MKKIIVLMLVISAAFLLNGCGNRGRKALVRINDEVITVEEFKGRINRLPRHYQEMVKGQEKKFLDEIIKERLLHNEALKANIENDPETQEVIAEAKKKILIARLVKNRVEDAVSISDEDLQKYYDEHSEEFMLPERWRASHILVDTPDEAEEIKEKLNQGAAFDELAVNRSKDATAKQGGDVGYFSKGQLLPEFEDVCFKLEIGEVGKVVKTQFGYHVIKLTDKKSPEVQEFSKVKGIIGKDLDRGEKQKLLEELMNDLHDNAEITINEELLNSEFAEKESESAEGQEEK